MIDPRQPGGSRLVPVAAQCWHCGHESRRHRDDGELCLDCLTTHAHQARTLEDEAADLVAPREPRR